MIGIITGAVAAVASFAGSVGTAIASIGSGIVSAVSSIGPALARFVGPIAEGAKAIIARFPKLDIGKIGELIETAMKIVHAVMDILGLNKHKMEQEEIGERALQNPEIKPEDYDTTEGYLDALHEGRYEKGKRPEGFSSDAWKAMCFAVATGIEVKAVSEKMKMATPMSFFIDCAKAGLVAKDMVDGKGGGLLEKMKACGADASELPAYLGTDSCSDAMKSAMEGFVSPATGLSAAQMAENYFTAR